MHLLLDAIVFVFAEDALVDFVLLATVFVAVEFTALLVVLVFAALELFVLLAAPLLAFLLLFSVTLFVAIALLFPL